MRGADHQSGKLFSYIGSEAMVPTGHPLRVIRPLVNAALDRLAADFEKIHSPIGRPSIAPEKLLRALLLQAFFSVRSERQRMEQLTYNTLFRWFTVVSWITRTSRLTQRSAVRRLASAITPRL